MNNWKVEQRLITDLGRYDCEPEFLSEELFCGHIKSLEDKGFRLEDLVANGKATVLTYAKTSEEGFCFITFSNDIIGE